MQIVSIGDNLHEMSNPVSWDKWEKYFKVLSAENVRVLKVLRSFDEWWFSVLRPFQHYIGPIEMINDNESFYAMKRRTVMNCSASIGIRTRESGALTTRPPRHLSK